MNEAPFLGDMPPSDPEAADRTSGDPSRVGEDPRVLLFMQPGSNRDLLEDALGSQYRVTTTTDVGTLEEGFDCCVFDTQEFNRVGGTVQPRRDTSAAVFLPFVLLAEEDSRQATNPEVWEYVDDVIRLPVRKRELLSRVGNLVERRRTAAALARREEQLRTTVEDLRLKERAMDKAPVGITITDPDREDNPLVYMNERFQEITGYTESVIGRNLRFLQGEETDPDTRAALREAIDADEPISVDIVNYRKNGERFWNKLDIAPVREDGDVASYVGFQVDITDRKIRERRLDVLNRVLAHNMRNKMNVIEGHTSLLRDRYDGEPPESLAAIERAASDLLGLADIVQDVELVLSESAAPGTVVELDTRIQQAVSGFRDRYPEVTFELSVPEGTPCTVSASRLPTAIEEAIENAVKHNDSREPFVTVRMEARPGGWLDIEIEDNGPGIPDQEISVLTEGETPLRHANRLGIWLIYWVVSKSRGTFSVSNRQPRGTVLSISVPLADPDR